MNKINFILFIVVGMYFISCKSKYDNFPVEKRYWDIKDYENVTRHLKYSFEPDESLPTFKNPETRIILEKLTDHQNYMVVLDDNELGLKHRNEVASAFFSSWKKMNTIYRETDRKDNYVYDIEMIKVFQFGLGLQLRYFKLGNDEIKATSDEQNSKAVRDQINTNVNTLINNYLIYLDEINNEKALSEEGKELFSLGVNEYFTKLIELYPGANYSGMERKIVLLEKKSESPNIKASLNNILKLIESKKNTELLTI